MTDFTPTAAPTVPPLASQLLTLGARHALTILAGFLIAKGVLPKDAMDPFMATGLALALGVGGIAWSVVSKLLSRATLKAAIAAPPPK
jgi:hypothetical protein